VKKDLIEQKIISKTNHWKSKSCI